MKNRARTTGRPLIVKPTRDMPPTSADSHQNPDYTVTKTHDDGGGVFANVEVAVIFWGKYWSRTTPPPTITSDTYYQAFTGVVTGPYMTGMRQYGFTGPGTMLGKWINDSSDPANGYSDNDVVNMLTAFLDANPAVPIPADGHNRFYAVVTPPGLNNALPDYGEHKDFTYKGKTSTFCWINDEGTLTDSASTGVVNTFSHELAEACTDPFLNAWHVDGKRSDGSTIVNDEIGDTCNNEYAIININGLKANLQCYWSAADNACILPQGTLRFLIDKNTFGLDEVKEAIKTSGGVFSGAFWVALDGYSIDTFNSFKVEIETPTGAFASLGGITIALTPATTAQPNPVYETSDTSVIQRIRYSFDVIFASPLVTPFPASSTDYPLTATFKVDGDTVPAPNSQDTVNFALVPGADPYFSNIDPTDANAVSWLSQDLRVFSLAKGASALPGDGAAPVFTAGQSPYDHIQQLIGYLNGNEAYTRPVPATSPDPLNGLVDQSGYETGDSSVTPTDASHNANFNFALARVRLMTDNQGSAGAATNVRVFFRLWTAPSCDTDFDPTGTYLSTPAYPALPQAPLASSASLPNDPSGQAIRTQPFFAIDQTGSKDYDPTTANNNIRDISVPVETGRDSVWAYYGCFLDVYDASNQAHLAGTHHCLVAQIAYDGAPLQFQAGVATNPGNTDKLAQRNLQITLSGNPGPKPTHRIPQAFDTRPSRAFVGTGGAWNGQPDELMIDWGHTPAGSTAHIYWPDVAASEVLALASRLYGQHRLVASDANTISCPVVKGVTYVPIPAAAGKTFAGLLTVDLPIGVKAGQEFNILVRRLATATPPPIVIRKSAGEAAQPADSAPPPAADYRYVAGAFQIKIPVTTEAHMLRPEEDTLAILKARLAMLGAANRWRPVLQRYIDYVAGRVDGSGGNAASIPPSLHGAPPAHTGGHGEPSHHHRHECDEEKLRVFEGKICGVVFDRYGDFEGFILDDEDHKRRFHSRERAMRELIERAWRERLRVIVMAEHDEPMRARTVILPVPPQ
ncbi:hypothetical protein P3T23_009100 [Paraburkholderia sp. GAS448]|uniref:hypothetical protein n=1 Tax=Paraburkholderia sp. GAS448 TaxID=3035136 RepID=UPI003D1B839B